MSDFFEVLRTRRTVRSYTDEPVSRQDLEELIDNAILAPTGMNLQPWAFTVVTDRAALRKINEAVVKMLRAPDFQKRMENERLREIVNAPGYDIFYGAPALIVISGNDRVGSAAFDCQLAAENLFLTAHAKGLGTCCMGFLMLSQDNPEVARLIPVPEGFHMRAAAVVGHPDVRPDGPSERNAPPVIWVE
jgi:nitroreductase